MPEMAIKNIWFNIVMQQGFLDRKPGKLYINTFRACFQIRKTQGIRTINKIIVSIFRFLRIAPPSEKPYVDHWTVGHYMDMEGLHFLDCSLEAGALYCLPYAKLTDAWRPLSREYVVIPPESVRVLSHARSFGLPV